MLASLLMCFVPQAQDPATGIAHELAVQRDRQLQDVRYELRFRIEPEAEQVTGQAGLTFTLDEEAAKQPVVIDFAGKSHGAVRVNNTAADLRAVNGHLIVSKDLLRPGRNEVAIDFASSVAPTGTPLSVYRDPKGGEYFYTLVVPADAHRLYPCFDQPDIKARFTIALDLPTDWVGVSNGSETVSAAEDDRRLWNFSETRPLPTYLMAFAAGPFAVVETPPVKVPGIDPESATRYFMRPDQRHLFDLEAIDRLHREGLRWLCDYFAVAYPFDKLDVVLLPGFPYGGMEHAGAIFYREQALVFDHPPTDSELVRRSTLIYHELSHQWFGNLVTMKWFDDLWLKEGFATFVAYKALQALEPERRAWLRFLQRVKPRAYAIDGTPGTTPVFQELQNLADAKSAYGAIVYNKAPAVLRELHGLLGADAFQRGLTDFLQRHSYSNATWRDLAVALESAASRDLGRWSERWLLAPSMPQVRIRWTTDDDGLVETAELVQEPVGGEGTWPLRVELLIFDEPGATRTTTVESDLPTTDIEAMIGKPAPLCVLANPTDTAYGQFVPNPQSCEFLAESVADQADPRVRAVMTTALFEAVREAELDPAQFVATALTLLRNEQDPDTHAWLVGAIGTCLGRYLNEDRAGPLRETVTELLMAQLAKGDSGRELQTFRFLARTGTGKAVEQLCRNVVRKEDLPPGLEPGKRDRFLAAAALLARGQGPEELEWLENAFRDEDVGKYSFMARAAAADAEAKARYWQMYLQLEEPPEQWTQDSLSYFHWPEQQHLTQPYLRRALDKAPWVKTNRRIFFMPAWLDSFINGHSDAEALAIVDSFLAETELADDIRKKLLQSRDGLERSVRIRNRFP